jgi:hypothetical protein
VSSCWPPPRPRHRWRWSATTSSSTTPRSPRHGWHPTRGCGCCTGPLQPPRQPGRAQLGRPQGPPGELADADHGRADPPSPCLGPQRSPAQILTTTAPTAHPGSRPIPTQPSGGRLAADRLDLLPTARWSRSCQRLAAGVARNAVAGVARCHDPPFVSQNQKSNITV